MSYSLLAARAAIGSAALAVLALAVLHLLERDLAPSRTMISRYALGRHGWVMALCFAAFAAASALLVVALAPYESSGLGRLGLACLLSAGVGLAMAARYPMDPVSTPRDRVSPSGKIHGLAFAVGVPCMLLAVLLLSLAIGSRGAPAALPLFGLAAATWASLAVMAGVMLKVGPGKPPDPNGPERFLGWSNRLFMIAYGAWLAAAAWPMAKW